MRHLKTEDFYIDTGKKGKVLCTTQKDIIFVFFHLDGKQCENCEAMLPEFMKLPNLVPQVKYALVDLSKNPEIAKKTTQTIAPIKYVPYLIVFVNNRPFLRYDGGKSSTEMAQFLRELLANIPKDYLQRIASNNNTVSSGAKFESEVPVYPAGGIPYNVVCDKNTGVCYLSFDELMSKKK